MVEPLPRCKVLGAPSQWPLRKKLVVDYPDCHSIDSIELVLLLLSFHPDNLNWTCHPLVRVGRASLALVALLLVLQFAFRGGATRTTRTTRKTRTTRTTNTTGDNSHNS